MKIFKDPIYDYIYIDNDVCEKIIDTAYFQRLRRVEQTSMRCLYPSARHDRFIHSIGVYHLAKLAVRALSENKIVYVDKDINEKFNLPTLDEVASINFAFEMAALLHDICHAPFSHTLEEYFQKIYFKDDNGEITHKYLVNELFEVAGSIGVGSDERDFRKYKADCSYAEASPHEIASCIFVLKYFVGVINELAKEESKKKNLNIKVDYLFLTRCILGALYSEASDSNDYKNCIIKLLNSSIDVDKLDYIVRDSSVSGFANTVVDTNRLLNSLTFAVYREQENKLKICLAFKKTAVGVIQNVVTSRNALYTWIYSHHKVAYESHIIKKAIKVIADKNGYNGGLFLSKYFTVDSIEKNLVCDDVIWNLFIENRDENIVSEIIDRGLQKKAVWKSFAEFQAYFNTFDAVLPVGDFSFEQMERVLKESDDELKEFKEYVNGFTCDGVNFEFEVVVNKTKLTHIGHNSVLIYINDKLYPFDTIFSDLYKKSEIPPFFYLYCRKNLKDILNKGDNKLKLVNYIKKYHKFRLMPNEK